MPSGSFFATASSSSSCAVFFSTAAWIALAVLVQSR